ncbi:MAG: recombinase family protein [Oscillospiraceae bacterium]
MRIAIYSRKSRFTGKGESIENQIALCRDYISASIPDAADSDITVYEDEGFSAKNLDRPQFRRMMESAEKQPFNYVVVYRLDRISRNVGDFAKLIEKLNSMHTAFICIKEQFDTSTPMGRAMMNIAAVFAQLERETIAERIKDNIVFLARTGRWLGGVTPLGYSAEKTEIRDEEGKNRSAFKLKQNSEEVKKVRTIFKKYLEFQSITRVRSWLIQHDYKTREGCDFGVYAIRMILRNPVYCPADNAAFEYFQNLGSTVCFDEDEADKNVGLMPFFRTAQNGKENLRTPPESWFIAKGKHKPVVTSEQWLKVQEILGENASKTFYRPGRNTVSLLTGLVRCTECGSIMRPHVNSSSRSLPDGTRTFMYMCTLKESSKKSKCSMKNVNGNELDKLVCDEILKINEPTGILKSQLDEMLKTQEIDSSLNEEKLSELQRLIREHKERIANLMKTLSMSQDSSTMLQYTTKEIERLDKEIKMYEKEVQELAAFGEKNLRRNQLIEEIIKSISDFRENYDNMSFAEKQDFMHRIIDRVEWDGEKAHIFLNR